MKTSDQRKCFQPESAPDTSYPSFSRRRLISGAVGAAAALGLLSPVARRLGLRGGNGQPVGAQTTSSPVATPLATPAAGTPAAATPETVEMLGSLEIRRGDRFSYPGDPLPSETLRLWARGGQNNLQFNPAAFGQDFQIMASYLDPLVWPDDVTMEPTPWLAESWEWSENGRRVTFTLRDDVLWHDGEPLRAEDVVFSFFVYRDDIESGARNLFTQMESAEALDDRTVAVNLSSRDGNWVLNAATQLIFQRRQYVDFWESQPEGSRTLSGFDWTTNDPVGTGPWVVGLRRSNGVTLTRNDDYWAGPPNFSAMRIDWDDDGSSSGVEAWNDGSIDLLWPISPADLPAVQQQPATLYATSGAQVMFAAFNFQNLARFPSDLLLDVRARQALALTIDRQRYATEVFASFVREEAVGTVAQPWAHDASLSHDPRNLRRAVALLAEIGLTDLNGDGLIEDFTGSPLVFSVIVRDDSYPFLIESLNSYATDLGSIGVGLNVRVLTPAEFLQTWTVTRDYDLIAYGYRLYPGFTDYDLYGSNYDIRINPQGWNPGGYDNRDVDTAIKRLLVATDPQTQLQHLRDLQRITNEDLFGIWLGFPDELILARNDLKGFQPNTYHPTWNTRLLWQDG